MRRNNYLFTVCLLALTIYSCSKSDSSQNFGPGTIYMPQAAQSGGSSIVYNVPQGMDAATYNYKIDTAGNMLNVILGVLRSGKMPNASFSVDIGTNQDTIMAAIANGSLLQGNEVKGDVILLPDAAYSLPSSVTVPSGMYQGTFYLSVDIQKLKAYSGKKMALAVALNNPTTYSLDSLHTETIVLIDVDAIKLP